MAATEAGEKWGDSEYVLKAEPGEQMCRVSGKSGWCKASCLSNENRTAVN